MGRHKSNDYGYKSHRRKIRKRTLFWIIVLLALFLTGYHYRAHLYAFFDHHVAEPPQGGVELPPTDPGPDEEDPADQEPEPEDPAGEEPDGEDPEDQTDPYPPPEGLRRAPAATTCWSW